MATDLQTAPPRSPYHGMRMSLAEYEALPEVKPYLEYIDGVVLQKPMPTRTHRKLELQIALLCKPHLDAIGGDCWPEAHIWFAPREHWRVPDLVLYAPGKPQGTDSRSLPPSVTIEIRSPGQSMAELRAKARFYRESGVESCWLIDPYTRTAECFDGTREAEPVETLTSSALPGLTVPVAAIWAAIPEDEPAAP